MGLSSWDVGSDSHQVAGVNRGKGLAGHRKIPALQWAKLPRIGREGAVEVRPFPAKKKHHASRRKGSQVKR